MRNIKKNIEKIYLILDEIKRYEIYKESLEKKLDSLFAEYQKRKYTHEEYQKRISVALEGKTKKEWETYYAAYIYSLLKQVEDLNYQVFYEAYENKDFERIRPIKRTIPLSHPSAALKHDAKSTAEAKTTILEDKKTSQKSQAKDAPGMPRQIPIELANTDSRSESKQEKIEEKKDRQVFDAIVKLEKQEQKKVSELEKKEQEKISLEKKLLLKKELEKKAFEKSASEKQALSEGIFKKDATDKKSERKILDKKYEKTYEKLKIPIPRPPRMAGLETSAPSGKKLVLPDKFKKKSTSIGVGGTFGYEFMKNLIKRFGNAPKKQERKTLLDLKLRTKDESPLFEKQETSAFSKSVINEEAKKIKNILERRQTPNIYQPSFFGAVANIMIKKVSFYLLDTFPEVFKALYNALRLANIRVLSNTYVNIMVLFVFLSSVIALPASFFLFVGKVPLDQLVLKTIGMTFLISLSTLIAFYAYPFAKIKERRRNINSNLPFAINHMAAVASSGVPPTRMFQLIADSPEYGEVSIEIAKIVEYIDLFGYDFLTALKSVAAISPSPSFKDFLEGLVSTIESGGDIKNYLSEKADEAMLFYELERQKYLESISTYSDIYTGILIAAPLFFVTALSMVSMLGGAIGGMDVNTVIVVGTYVVVPMLNVAFILFLSMTQPEV